MHSLNPIIVAFALAAVVAPSSADAGLFGKKKPAEDFTAVRPLPLPVPQPLSPPPANGADLPGE